MKYTNRFGFDHLPAYEVLVVKKLYNEWTVYAAFHGNQMTQALKVAKELNGMVRVVNNPNFSEMEKAKNFGF